MKGVISTTNWASRRDGTRVVALDPLLEPYVEALKYRFGRYWELKQSLDMLENGVAEFSKGMKFFGFNVVNDGILYREVGRQISFALEPGDLYLRRAPGNCFAS
mmetsp:Transcript_31441/g.121669  ORF Transcript_31441/g.121669 Transcript_31441/m.121669 type:complete len:104 (+) Transcript_31441:597-908(+)